jgi:hypothetical protein
VSVYYGKKLLSKSNKGTSISLMKKIIIKTAVLLCSATIVVPVFNHENPDAIGYVKKCVSITKVKAKIIHNVYIYEFIPAKIKKKIDDSVLFLNSCVWSRIPHDRRVFLIPSQGWIYPTSRPA